MLFFLFLPLLSVQLAQATTVQELWIFPAAPDFTSDITTGTTVQVRWHAGLASVFSSFCTECNTSHVDLWLTGSQYSERLRSGINVEKTFSFSWRADLNASIITASPDWSFRFLPSGAIWNGTGGQEISSAQFTILEAIRTSTTFDTSAAASTAMSSSTPTSNSTTATSQPTSTSSQPKDNNGLSPGAKAGAGVGAAVGAIVFMALLIFFWRKAWKHRQRTRGIQEAPDGGVYMSPDQHGSDGPANAWQPPMYEDSSSRPALAKAPSELPTAAGPSEMDAGADGQMGPIELEGTH